MKKLAVSLIIVFLLISASCPSEPDPYVPPVINIVEHSPNAKRLLNYIADMYGEKIISGQMDAAWDNSDTLDMIARVYADTGKYPALKGFDLIELPHSWGGYGKQQIDEAIEWWEGKNNGVKLLEEPDIHGIVTFCWHWRMLQKTGNYKDFYTRNTDFRIPFKDGKLDTTSAAFTTIKDDLDKVADLLKELKDKDIPVLWRPLHEAAGGWFWWGASGAKPYIALWEFMYDYLSNTKGLNNLIWVWNGQNADWFPFADTVSIIGYDVYTNANSAQLARNYSSQVQRFNQTRNMVPLADRSRIIVALTENGAIPDPDNCKNDNAMWSWFCTWNDDKRDNQVTDGKNSNPDSTDAFWKGCFWTGEYHNTNAHKDHVYKHELVITLDKLPDLTKYRLE